jgi:hypothetical protein
MTPLSFPHHYREKSVIIILLGEKEPRLVLLSEMRKEMLYFLYQEIDVLVTYYPRPVNLALQHFPFSFFHRAGSRTRDAFSIIFTLGEAIIND